MQQAHFNNIRSIITPLLREAQKEVAIAMAWFTSAELFFSHNVMLEFGNKYIVDDNDTHSGFGRHKNSYSRYDNHDYGYSQSYDDFHDEQDDYDMMGDDF